MNCSTVIAARALGFLSGNKNCQQLFVGGFGLSELCSAGKGCHNLTSDPLQQRQEAMFRSAGQPNTGRAQLHLCWNVPLFLTLRWATDSSPTCPGIPVRWFAPKMSHNPPSYMGRVMGLRDPSWGQLWSGISCTNLCMNSSPGCLHLHVSNVWRHTESPNSHTNKYHEVSTKYADSQRKHVLQLHQRWKTNGGTGVRKPQFPPLLQARLPPLLW